MAAGTVTITEERLSNVKKVTFAWTAGTAGEAGTASGQTTYPYTGNLLKVVTVPGTGGDAPDDNYTVTLKDEDAIDIANGQLAACDQTNTELWASSLGAVVGDKLTFAVSGAGSANKGTCVAYIGVTPDSGANVNTENALYGAAGITTWPAAAAPANGVSLAEGLRYAVETQLGAMERAVEKSDGAVLLGSDDLFTITGGPILVTEFVGIVTTVIGGAANCHIDMVVTEPAGTVALSTNVAIDTDAAGTSYTFTAATPGVLTPTTAGALDQVPVIRWLCPAGTLKAHCSAAQTGVIKWYLVYRPLSPNSVVVAAA